MLLLTLLSLVSTPVAGESIKITEDTFTTLVQSQGFFFIKFYAPWCFHCQSMQQDWETLADHIHKDHKISGLVRMGEVDCTTSPVVCAAQGVHAYPTLVLYKDGAKHTAFSSHREFDRMLEFLYSEVEGRIEPNHLGIYQLNDRSWEQFNNDQEQTPVLVGFYTQTHSFKNIFQDLAGWFLLGESADLQFAEVDCTDPGSTLACQQAGVNSMPTLLMFRFGGIEDTFDGNSDDIEELKNFVWETVDPDRIEDNETEVDFSFLQTMSGLGAAGPTPHTKPQEEHDSDSQSDNDDESEHGEDAEDDDDDEDLLDLPDKHDQQVEVLQDLVDAETNEEIKKVLQTKLVQIKVQRAAKDFLGDSYHILVDHIRRNISAEAQQRGESKDEL